MNDKAAVIGAKMGLFKSFTNRFVAPGASVQVKLASYAISLGETLQGSLNVSSREDFDATEVRCEILCTERTKVLKQVYDPALKTSIPKIVEDSVILYNVKPSLSAATHFANGENRFFPVNVNIPAGATPTISSLDRGVRWNIKGVIAVDGRPDCTSQTSEIAVVAPTLQAAAAQREVIRTVVMIPCKYCQGLMDQTFTVCPTCGAQRSI